MVKRYTIRKNKGFGNYPSAEKRQPWVVVKGGAYIRAFTTKKRAKKWIKG